MVAIRYMLIYSIYRLGIPFDQNSFPDQSIKGLLVFFS